ncbi:DHA2 family efflux MFS transporter permease subunit [Paenibacillus sp. GbtcB18]|uniref:DHA2 family efflux MFS transporter permease subunit n=1 Tax=Paenibacillus sp. GbtcB18 TaxID=2824763 RepID=UPI001C2FCD01|nr:DHA2 family efflux MFS transporter permease subunit [Paenibacillus sp. GbtcB18]
MQKSRKIPAILTLLLGFFMAILDTSIVNVALPRMSEFYGADTAGISWVVNGYSLSFAVFLLAASRLADQFGRKKAFMTGLFLFTLSSLLCGLAGSITSLILFRVLQGIGAALITPLVAPLLLALFPPEKKAVMMGITGALAGLAAASGPALGGVLSYQLDWQWIFYINIPIGALALVLAASSLAESYDPTATRKLDWGGMLTVSAASLTLTLAFMQANEKGWASPYILSLFAAALVSLLLFLWIESRVKEPMLPLSLFRIKRFPSGNLGLFLLGIGMTGPTFILAFFLTQVIGMTELRAGLIISVLAVASMICSVLAAKGAAKLGPRIFSVTGMILLALGTYLLAGLTTESSTMDYIWRLVIAGMGTGMAIANLTATTVLLPPPEKTTIAMGIGTMARTIGSALGIAVLVTLLSQSMQTEMASAKTELAERIASSSLSGESKAGLAEALQQQAGSRRAASGSASGAMQGLLDQLDRKEREQLQAASPDAAGRVKETFAKDKAELQGLLPQLQATLNTHTTGAFGLVFKISCLALLLGAVCAFVNGRRAAEPAQEAERVENALRSPQ